MIIQARDQKSQLACIKKESFLHWQNKIERERARGGAVWCQIRTPVLSVWLLCVIGYHHIIQPKERDREREREREREKRLPFGVACNAGGRARSRLLLPFPSLFPFLLVYFLFRPQSPPEMYGTVSGALHVQPHTHR